MVERFERFSIAMMRISKSWHKLCNEEMTKHGLKGPHATYLTVMYRFRDGITVPKLCELCGKDKSDASRMLAILEEKELVIKRKVDGSLYRGLLYLTEKGKVIAEKVMERASSAVEAAGRELDEKTREGFYRVLESVASNLGELCKEGIPENE